MRKSRGRGCFKRMTSALFRKKCIMSVQNILSRDSRETPVVPTPFVVTGN